MDSMIRSQALFLFGLSISVSLGAELLASPMVAAQTVNRSARTTITQNGVVQTLRIRMAERATQAQSTPRSRPRPPRKGRFVPIRGGGSRGCGDVMRPLVPTEEKENARFSTGGVTVSANPDFWVHVPHKASEVKKMDFLLESSEGNLVFETSLQPPNTPGIVRVKFPESAPPLEEGQSYRWVMSADLLCPTLTSEGGSAAPQPSIDQSDGWLRRKALDAALTQQLQREPETAYRVYGDNEVWFDAITSLAQQLRVEPDNAQLRQEWNELLEIYGLGDYSAEPFSDCCEPQDGTLLPGEGS